MSHGGGAQKNDFTGRLPNVLLALVMFSLLATANGQQCEKGDEKEEGVEHLWMWLAILALIHIVVMTGIYMEKMRADEALAAARESRAALNIQCDELVNLRALTTDGHRLIRNAIMEMDLHSSLCPFTRPIHMATTGECWHHENCHVVRQITSTLMTRRACAYCASLRPPPDRVEDHSGTTLRRELEAWLADADPWRPP
ncbi:unnamed protein product [Durusdinium trenchii]|uniref:Uncharacterized protein n=2 Tax=Durusdinium trenchii TaxID=1381693 RepID=A0ABP0JQZ4_9DINO